MNDEQMRAFRMWIREVMTSLSKCHGEIGTDQLERTWQRYHELAEELRVGNGVTIKLTKPDWFHLGDELKS